MNEHTVEIYNHTINFVEKRFGGYISNIRTRYKKYVNNKYDNIIEGMLLEPVDINDVVADCQKEEQDFWSRVTVLDAQELLIKDPAFETLLTRSNKIYQKALTTLTTGATRKNKSEYENTRQGLLNFTFSDNPKNIHQIYSFNKARAEELISESLLDLDFAFGKSPVKSSRLSNVNVVGVNATYSFIEHIALLCAKKIESLKEGTLIVLRQFVISVLVEEGFEKVRLEYGGHNVWKKGNDIFSCTSLEYTILYDELYEILRANNVCRLVPDDSGTHKFRFTGLPYNYVLRVEKIK